MPENNTSNKGTHPLLFKGSTLGIPFYFTRSNQVKSGQIRSNTLSDFGTGHLAKKSAESKSSDHKILCIYETSEMNRTSEILFFIFNRNPSYLMKLFQIKVMKNKAFIAY